jgi:Ca-activated chloride channel family protein
MNPEMVSSQGTSLDEAIKLSATYFDDDKQTNKLLILISDGEDHSEGTDEASETVNNLGIKIITIGVGTEKGGPIPLRQNGRVASFKRDQNDEVVVTKLNSESLKAIAKNSKGYVSGNNTKEVLEYVKNALDNIEKTEFETQQFTDFNSQFQWFLGIAFAFLFLDVLFLERKTKWVKKLNLFNEKE